MLRQTAKRDELKCLVPFERWSLVSPFTEGSRYSIRFDSHNCDTFVRPSVSFHPHPPPFIMPSLIVFGVLCSHCTVTPPNFVTQSRLVCCHRCSVSPTVYSASLSQYTREVYSVLLICFFFNKHFQVSFSLVVQCSVFSVVVLNLMDLVAFPQWNQRPLAKSFTNCHSCPLPALCCSPTSDSYSQSVHQ